MRGKLKARPDSIRLDGKVQPVGIRLDGII